MGIWGKDGEDGVMLSKIKLFDNWGTGIGEEKTNLTKRKKSDGGNHNIIEYPERLSPTR
jgi:hypothetical protein